MNDIRDVKPPVYLPDLWWLWWVLLGMALMGAGIYFWLHRNKFHRETLKPPEPELPAWETAYRQLEALRLEGLPQKGLFKEFYTRVADIARLYMENRFNIHAPHMTSEEFLCDPGTGGHLNETQKTALKEFLDSCDMVKFAKHAPTIHEALKNFDLAKRLVDDTRI